MAGPDGDDGNDDGDDGVGGAEARAQALSQWLEHLEQVGEHAEERRC